MPFVNNSMKGKKALACSSQTFGCHNKVKVSYQLKHGLQVWAMMDCKYGL